ncbi:3-oxoacyl-[acyl-carrier-protein] synthase III C-terminal domain-containing protein [Virgibacillus sp. C22-A2]|uniref:3-oxoacyl-[acyl-carrier-protein] synthase III C-terminal domain-containing protein n=1 Tax=Virgibacillus tibetensis TaxID=3042313 RepID=A0ABU6KKM3_9BACI|nr:3-oxoacyl-[acyl-carrier-protein] synthase III C-terminal domain-containing protein [Virgibacillus sp. C22-A2]
MQIGIRKIATHIPEGRQSIEELFEENQLSGTELKLMKRFHGLSHVPIVEFGKKIEDLLVVPLSKIFQGNPSHNIKLIIYAHTGLHVPYNYDLLYKVLRKFDLQDIHCLGFSHLNCASFFTALKTSYSFLKESPHGTEVLILCGDQTNFVPEGRYLPKSSIMGDSATALMLNNKMASKSIMSIVTFHDVEYYQGVYASDKEMKLFYKAYDENLDRLINQTLEEANLQLEQIDWILPHNVNITTWKSFSRRNSFALDKIMLDLIPDIAHTFNTDAQINFDYGIRKGKIKKDDICLLIGIGLGSFLGSCIIKV